MGNLSIISYNKHLIENVPGWDDLPQIRFKFMQPSKIAENLPMNPSAEKIGPPDASNIRNLTGVCLILLGKSLMQSI